MICKIFTTDHQGLSNCGWFASKFATRDNIRALERDVSPSYCDALDGVPGSVLNINRPVTRTPSLPLVGINGCSFSSGGGRGVRTKRDT